MAEEKSTRSTRGISLPVLLGIIILVIMMAAGTSFLMVYLFGRATDSKPKLPATSKVEQKDVKPGITHDMEQVFVVNLLGSRHYLKVAVALEVEKEEVVEEIKLRNAQLRDAINEIFRAQKYEDVQDPELKQLKAIIIARVNQILTKGKVRSVWFPEFQIQ